MNRKEVSIVIRRTREEDLDQICAIEEAAFSQPWTREGFLSSLKTQDTIYLTVIRSDTGEIAGYCGLLYQKLFAEADITNVAVREAERGSGIGRRMLTRLMDEARDIGIRSFMLEVRVSNEKAIRLYRSLGFEVLGIRKHFYELPAEDAYIMQLELQTGTV